MPLQRLVATPSSRYGEYGRRSCHGEYGKRSRHGYYRIGGAVSCGEHERKGDDGHRDEATGVIWELKVRILVIIYSYHIL